MKATEWKGEKKREIEIRDDRKRIRDSQEHREFSYGKTLHSIQNSNYHLSLTSFCFIEVKEKELR